jgi:simple sugar transport system substrate-binding protein
MNRRDTLKLLGLTAASAALPLAASRAAEPTMVTVVKITGIPWFNLVDKGLQRGGKKFGVNVSMTGPAHVDPAQQVSLVEDLIAKRVDAIGLVPLDVKVLAPVLERAQ